MTDIRSRCYSTAIGDIRGNGIVEKKNILRHQSELGAQARRSSNSSPAQLAEKHDDRHILNKIEGVNRSRGEASETLHHLFMAFLKKYETRESYESFRDRYEECIRMLNGMQRTLEQYLPESDRRWPPAVKEESSAYDACPPGYPET